MVYDIGDLLRVSSLNTPLHRMTYDKLVEDHATFRSSVEEHTSRPELEELRGHVDPLITDLKKKADADFKDPGPRSSLLQSPLPLQALLVHTRLA